MDGAFQRPAQRDRLDGLAVGVMLGLCTLWGVQQVASKVALAEGMAPLMQAVLRSAIAGPLLVGWLWLRRGRAGVANLVARDGSWGPGALIALMFALEFAMLFPGVRLTSASHAVVLLFTGGLFTAAGAHVFVPGERMVGWQWGGLGLAFLGVVVTVLRPFDASAAGGMGAGQASFLGDLLVLGAAAAWGLTTVVVKASPRLNRLSPEKVLTYQLLGALPPLLVVAWGLGELGWPQATVRAWWLVVFQGAGIAFGSYLAWYWLVSRYPAGRLGAFSFLTPILGVAAAALLLGEPMGMSLVAGLVCVCLGLRLVNR